MSVILISLKEVKIGQVSILHSMEHLEEMNNEQDSFVLDATVENLKALEKKEHDYFIPSGLLRYINEDSKARVYFDLECYPFYRKIKQVIENGSKANGVFRFRRMTSGENLDIMADDLYVLSLLFGEPKEKHIKKTKRDFGPNHMILMVRFESGAMAHVEFTTSTVDRVEMEWSGMRQIIEFDSEELSGQLIPLQFTAADVKSVAKNIDAELIDRVRFFRSFIAGGTLI